ncbi:MAG: hypothetical protein J6Y77_07075 [Paludibacteraceae bacterium]|nr:hypothetical protein [Paludibacteraceae bacterium]
MAEKETENKEMSVEDKLKALYQLQTIVSKIDKIKILRGELPFEVQDLEDEIVGLQTRISNNSAEVTKLQAAIVEKNQIITTAQENISRYETQIDNVRNNREFDHLTKEIEFEKLEIELANKNIREINARIEQTKEAQQSASTSLEEKNAILAEKKEELDEIIVETKQEEEKLREEAKAVETQIEPRLLQAFKRIHKNARNGLAVVYIQRDACGGCFNKIPAQRQMDIKLRKKIIVCEHCGRILIDPDLAGVTE